MPGFQFTRPAVAALVLVLAACSGTPNRPDHGRYTATVAAAPAVQSFVFPRSRRAGVVAPVQAFPCAVDRAMRFLRDMGLAAETVPEGAPAGDGALLLVVRIETLQGPGAFWSPFSGAIASNYARTDISVAIHDPGQATPLWRARTRVRAALTCADEELLAQLQQLLTHIQ